MKKIAALLSMLLFSVTLFSQTNLIEQEATITHIDNLQKNVPNFKWDELTSEHTSLIHWFVGDWIYVISYEPIETYVYGTERKLYLYKKNIADNGDWILASNQYLDIHSLTRNRTGYSYEQFLVNDGGNCMVLALHGEKFKDVFVVLSKVTNYHKGDYEAFTDIYVFVPALYINDGSIRYSFGNFVPSRDNVVNIQSIENNVLFTTDNNRKIVIDLHRDRRVIFDGDFGYVMPY